MAIFVTNHQIMVIYLQLMKVFGTTTTPVQSYVRYMMSFNYEFVTGLRIKIDS